MLQRLLRTLSSTSVALSSLFAAAYAHANEVTDWNTKTEQLIQQQNPMEQAHTLAIVQLAVHDALNAIEQRYAAYAFADQSPGASPEAAVLGAAYATLQALLSNRGPELDAWYEQARNALPNGAAKDQGLRVGRNAGERLIQLRSGDDLTAALLKPYTAPELPGVYRATPPDNAVFGAGWGELDPFMLPRASSFRPAPPPRLNTWRYTQDYAEVKLIGVKSNSSRSAEQTQIADFWYESSSTGWNRIANKVVTERCLDLWDSARVLALVAVALNDGFVNGFNAKYHFDYWRPITAIRLGDEDGNRRTSGDADWAPYCATPPVADYPSTHSVLGAAAAAVLARYFGDNTEFTADSLTLPGVTRTFDSFSDAAHENGESRIFCGIHWRSSVQAGLKQGRQLGDYVFKHGLKRKAKR